MKSLEALKVEILATGQVAVTPFVPDKMFEFIYRAAAGVEWKETESRFLSPSQSMLGQHNALSAAQRFEQLAAALSSEFRVRLVVSAKTIWASVPDKVRGAIERAHAAQPGVQADVHEKP